MIMWWGLLPAFLIGLFLGGLLLWFWGRANLGALRERVAILEQAAKKVDPLQQENEQLKIQAAELRKEREADVEKLQFVNVAEEKMREAFQALASQSLQINAEEFIKRASEQVDGMLDQVRGDWKTQRAELQNLVEPLEKTLSTMDGQVRELEKKREGAYQVLQNQVGELGRTHTQLQVTTAQLAQALKSPTTRGRWGELQLRRVVELAGMAEHVDFEEQYSTDEGRPDMIIRLPDSGILPVDAKTPMTAFLGAIEAVDDSTKNSKLDEHAKALRSRVRNLSKNPYSKQFDKAPEFVVMFIPNEACLSAAFDQDAELFEFAIQQRVLITTPVTLLALLKAAGYGWQQYQMANNIRQIAEQGKQMYDRLSVFVRHLNDVGHKLNQAVEQYNEAVGSLESRVLPSAMRFRELGATSAELPEPKGIEHRARLPRHVELDVEHV